MSNSAGRPNIVFVFDDQHRCDSVGCTGNALTATPNIDRLAGEGTVFDQAFACYPLCSPFPAQLLTGTYCHVNGVVCNEYRLFDDQPTLASALGRTGYRTAYVGKWHLGAGPYPPERRAGFDELMAYNCGHGFRKTHYFHNEDGPTQLGCWAPAGETDLALDYLRRHADDQPFALFLSWAGPHWPYDDYPQEFNSVDPADVTVAPNVPKPLEPFARRQLAEYYGFCAALDAQFGRIIDALDRLGLAENTIVVFTSDHGDHLWSHGYGRPMDFWLHPSRRASKATPYNESVRIPFVIRWPGRVPAGDRTDAMLGSCDMMPTLLALAGVDCPDCVQGADLSHACLGRAGESPDSVYLQNMGVGWPNRAEFTGFWRAVRTQRYMYARWLDDEQPRLLFDVVDDPFEMTNLADSEDHATLRDEMENRLQRWIAETKDPFDTGPRGPKRMLALGQQFGNDRWT